MTDLLLAAIVAALVWMGLQPRTAQVLGPTAPICYPVALRNSYNNHYVANPFDGQLLWVGGCGEGELRTDTRGRHFVVGP